MARFLATLGLLLTAALFAGCASAPPEVPAEAPDRLAAVPAEDEGYGGPTKVVPLSTTELVGTPRTDHVVGVEVPEGALALRATLTFRPGLVEDLVLEVAGCELLRTSAAMAGTGTVVLGGECEDVPSGPQQATLAFAAGGFVGTLQVEAVMPA